MLPKDGKMHFSNLKNFDKSPAHYAVSCESGFKDSREKRIGRAVHAYWLERKNIVSFDGVRRGKAWDEFCAETLENHGVKAEDILNQDEYDTASEMIKALNKNKAAFDLISKCHTIEEPLDWVRNGVECSGTPDAYGDDILIELKTCKCAKPRKFLYDAHNFSYHAQMAWYDIALGTQYIPGATKWRVHYIIAVENVAPYSVVVYALDNLRIDQGHTLCEEWLERYKECQSTGFFPSYDVEEPVIWDGEIIVESQEEEED